MNGLKLSSSPAAFHSFTFYFCECCTRISYGFRIENRFPSMCVCGQQKLMKNIIRSFIAITCALRRFEYMLFQFQFFFSLNSAPAFYFFFRFISLLLRLTVFFMHSANFECRMRKRWYISCKFRHIMTDMVAGISFRPEQSRANYGSMKSRRRFDEKSTV